MARVEGMPLDALQAGLTWDWRASATGSTASTARLGVNAGFLVGHSALRRAAMGEAAATAPPPTSRRWRQRRCTRRSPPARWASRRRRRRRTTTATATRCRHASADDDELLALAAARGRAPGHELEVILAGCLSRVQRRGGRPAGRACPPPPATAQLERPRRVALEPERPRAPAGGVRRRRRPRRARGRAHAAAADAHPAVVPHRLRARRPARLGRGARACRCPSGSRRSRIPRCGERLDAGAALARGRAARAGWRTGRCSGVAEAFAPANAPHEGRTHRRRGRRAWRQDPFDVLLDIVVADELRTGLRPPAFGDSDADWAAARARCGATPAPSSAGPTPAPTST